MQVELRGYEEVRRWLSDVRQHGIGSEKTAQVYLDWLGKFCQWTKKNPQQLVAERKVQLKSDDEAVKRTMENLVTDYGNFLETEHVNPRTGKHCTRATVLTMNGTIRSFFESNYVPIQSRVPRSIQPENPRKPVSLDELKSLLKVAGHVRNQALIALSAYSGMSREDVTELTYGHVKKELEAGTIPIRLEVRRRKAAINYETWIGHEVLDYLKPYLDIRRKGTRDIPPETLTVASPLFRKFKVKVQSIDVADLGFVVRDAAEKAGVVASPHRLRKFFETNMAVNGVPPVVASYWMGHTVSSDVESHYVLPSVEQQQKLYTDAVSKFSIVSSPIDERLEVIELERTYEARTGKNAHQVLHDWDKMTTKQKKIFLELGVSEMGPRTSTKLSDIVPDLKVTHEARNGNGRPYETKLVNQHNEEEIADLVAQGWDLVSNTPVNGNGNLLLRRKQP